MVRVTVCPDSFCNTEIELISRYYSVNMSLSNWTPVLTIHWFPTRIVFVVKGFSVSVFQLGKSHPVPHTLAPLGVPYPALPCSNKTLPSHLMGSVTQEWKNELSSSPRSWKYVWLFCPLICLPHASCLLRHVHVPSFVACFQMMFNRTSLGDVRQLRHPFF